MCSLYFLFSSSSRAQLDRREVEEANKEAPTFSRIFKEMILVTSREKPMLRAGKGTVMKKATMALYASEIDALYVCFVDPYRFFFPILAYVGTRLSRRAPRWGSTFHCRLPGLLSRSRSG